MKKPLKYGLFLLVLGIIVATLLAFVNSITAPIIAENELKEVRPLLEELDSDSNEFKDVTDDYDDVPDSISKIFLGTKNGKDNTIVYWTTTYGYSGGEIKVLTGVKLDTKKVLGTKVTGAANQTAGIGDKILDFDFETEGKDVSFYANKDVEAAIKSKELISITGATVSSKGFLEGVVIASTHFVEEFGEGDNESADITTFLPQLDRESDEFVEVTDQYTDLPEGILKVFNGKLDDEINSVIYLSSTPGYKDGLIEMLTAFEVEGNTILGTKVTDASTQTKNLGDKIVDYDFKTEGKEASFYAELNLDENIDELEVKTGATESSKGYYRGIILASTHFVEGLGE